MSGREKQNRFALEYLRGMDLERAAEAAGLKPRPELMELCAGEIEAWRKALTRQVTYQDVVRRLVELGFGRANDCARLLEPEAPVETLDLCLLSEMKRSERGAVEIKLVDRLAVLTRLLELLREDEDGAESFLLALQPEGEGEEP